MADGSHMDTNLVGAPRLKVHLGELSARHEFKRVVMGDGALPAVDHSHAPLARRVATDRRVNGA